MTYALARKTNAGAKTVKTTANANGSMTNNKTPLLCTNVCIDILYDEYHTGSNTMSVWRKNRFYVKDIMLDLNIHHPLKSQLRGYVKKAFINQMLEAN